MSRRWQKARKRFVQLIVPPLRAISPRLTSRVLAAIGRLEHALVPGSRARLERAVRDWAEHLGACWDAAAIGRELAANEVRWLARDQVLDGLNESRLDRVVRVRGRDHLDRALAEDRGIVLLGNHFGSHLVPSHWLLRQGYPLRIYMERPHHVSRFLARHFASDGPLGQDKLLISRRGNTAESAASILRAVKVLRAGMVLCLAGDVRWNGPNTAPAWFLGEQHSFTATWVALAEMTGAPVVPNFCRMARDGCYDLEFRAPFHVRPSAKTTGLVADYVQSCLREIEAQLRLDPTNGNEYVSWSETVRESPRTLPASRVA